MQCFAEHEVEWNHLHASFSCYEARTWLPPVALQLLSVAAGRRAAE